MDYKKYYREEGKTSTCMVKKITNNEELKRICNLLIEHKIGAYLTSDGYVHAKVGAGKSSLKATVCKDLGFGYISENYWFECYNSNDVKRIRELAL